MLSVYYQVRAQGALLVETWRAILGTRNEIKISCVQGKSSIHYIVSPTPISNILKSKQEMLRRYPEAPTWECRWVDGVGGGHIIQNDAANEQMAKQLSHSAGSTKYLPLQTPGM